MHKKILKMWKKIGMHYFWGDYFDARFYIANIISKKHKKIFLDIGCGPGIMLHLASADLKIGVDFSFKLLKKAKLLDPNFQLICCDVKHIPLRNDYFEQIMAIHIISTFSSKEERIQVCNEIKRISNNKCELLLNGANRLSKYFEKSHSIEKRKNYLHYSDLIKYFKEFEIDAYGYGDYSRKMFFPIKKLMNNLPEKVIEKTGIEQRLFNKLLSKKALKNGRSYILFCRKK